MARLRDLLRTTTAAVLSLGLTLTCVSNGSISHAATAAFGTVVSSDRAHVGNAAATVGTAVFRIVVSSASMKNATATSQGSSRRDDSGFTARRVSRRTPGFP